MGSVITPARPVSSPRCRPPAGAHLDPDQSWWNNTPPALVATPAGGITELLWWALTRLSHERRWLAWIAPPGRPSAAALAAHGLDISHVLVVQVRPGSDPLPVAERALITGHCSAVLVWSAGSDEARLARFRRMATAGRTLGVWFPVGPCETLQATTHHG